MSAARGRALVTMPDVASPPDSGRRLRSWSVLEALDRHFDLDVMFVLDHDQPIETPLPPTAGDARWTRIALRAAPTAIAAGGLVLGRLPWWLSNRDWRSARRDVSDWVRPEGYDFVWYGGIGHGLLLSSLIRSRHTVVDFDDVESAKWTGYLRHRRPSTVGEIAEYTQRVIELPMWRRVERRVARLVDTVVISAPEDVATLARLGIRDVRVLPNTYPDPGPGVVWRPVDPPVLAMVANFVHGPNGKAAHVLAAEVLPALREVLPEARVRLVGRGAEAIRALSDLPGVDVVGAVPDVAPHLRDVIATAMPIHYGGGTRLKALEAFALGVPVISTGVGVHGLAATDGKTYLRAETPREFVQCVLRLVGDPDLAARLTAAARRHYQARFTPTAMVTAMDELLARPPSGAS
jgi:glycosyltransferase involved in cell wall biosynthesis